MEKPKSEISTLSPQLRRSPLRRGLRGRAAVALLTTSAMALSACTTSLRTMPDRIAPTSYNMAVKGIPYALPMLQYKIDVTRRLAACGDTLKVQYATVGDSKEVSTAYWLPSLAFALSATAKSKMVEGERYLIDYERLSGPSKISDFQIEYFENTNILKSVNASADDQTAEIIGKTIAAGLSIIAIATGPAGAGAAAAAAAAGAAMSGGAPVKFKMGNSAGNNLRTETDAGFKKLFQEQQDKDMEELNGFLADTVIQGAVIECVPEIAVKVTARAKLASEKDNLETGDVTEILPDAHSKQADGKPLLAPVDGKITLAMINAEIEKWLPLMAAQPAPADTVKKLEKLIEWQSIVLAHIASKAAEIADADAALSVSASDTWPDHFYTRGKSEIAALSTGGRVKLAGMLAPSDTLSSEGRRYVDEAKVAYKLHSYATSADQSQRDTFNRLKKNFGGFVAGYLYPDNGKKLITTAAAGCAGPQLDEAKCLNASLRVAAEFEEFGEMNANAIQEEAFVDLATWQKATGDDKNFFTPVNGRDLVADSGIFVRPGVPRILQVCLIGDMVNNKLTCAAPATNLVKDEIVYVPQEGQLRILPLQNGPFQNNGLILDLSQDGRIKKFSYANKRAVAAAVAAAASDAAKQGQDFDTARREQAQNAYKNQAAKLQDQIDVLKNSKALADAKKLPTDDEKAEEALLQQQKDFIAETTRLDAQRLNIIAKACLAAAQKDGFVPQACPAS